MNMLWIHCNNCYDNYCYKKNRQFLLACYHIICEKCTKILPAATPNSAISFICPKCVQNVRGVLIGDTMPTHLKELFHPQPFSDNLPMARILKFQMLQRQHFRLHVQNFHQQLMEKVQKCALMRKSVQKLYDEQQILKNKHKFLVMKLNEIERNQQQIFDNCVKTTKYQSNIMPKHNNNSISKIATFNEYTGYTKLDTKPLSFINNQLNYFKL